MRDLGQIRIRIPNKIAAIPETTGTVKFAIIAMIMSLSDLWEYNPKRGDLVIIIDAIKRPPLGKRGVLNRLSLGRIYTLWKSNLC